MLILKTQWTRILLGHLELGFIESYDIRLEEDFKDHLVQPLLANASLDKMTQHHVQLNLVAVQYWGIHHFPGEIMPMDECSDCK